MSDLRQLAVAAGEALTDAERQGAKVAAHFLRVQVYELFRLARHVSAAEHREDEGPSRDTETNRFHNGG